MDNEESIMEGYVTTGEASELTGYNPEYLRVRAREGKVEARKVFGRWAFDREALLAYKARMDALGPEKYSPTRDTGDDAR